LFPSIKFAVEAALAAMLKMDEIATAAAAAESSAPLRVMEEILWGSRPAISCWKTSGNAVFV
jgi:hypothetical protein